MFTILPNSKPSVAHGVQSATASTQNFFYQPLDRIADSTVT